jgi:hypothetical protein
MCICTIESILYNFGMPVTVSCPMANGGLKWANEKQDLSLNDPPPPDGFPLKPKPRKF